VCSKNPEKIPYHMGNMNLGEGREAQEKGERSEEGPRDHTTGRVEMMRRKTTKKDLPSSV